MAGHNHQDGQNPNAGNPNTHQGFLALDLLTILGVLLLMVIIWGVGEFRPNQGILGTFLDLVSIAIFIVMMTLVPGYLLTLLLINPGPSRFGEGGPAGWAIWFTVGIATLTLILVGLSRLGLEVTAPSVLGTVVGLDASLVIAVALRRRIGGIPGPEQARGQKFKSAPGSHTKIWMVAAAVPILLILILMILIPAPAEPFTEFYLLAEGGPVSELPTDARPGEDVTVRVGIANHEGTAIRYLVSIKAALIGDDSNITEVAYLEVDLDAGEDALSSATFTILEPGDHILTFDLYRDVVIGDPYRSLSMRLAIL